MIALTTAVANQAEHTRLRRMLAPAFTERALMEQEPLLTYYFDLLVTKLKQRADGPGAPYIDLMAYFNFLTFDIIGSAYYHSPLLLGIGLTHPSDLCLGEAFGALEAEEYHTWIRFVAGPRARAYSQVRTGMFLSPSSC